MSEAEIIPLRPKRSRRWPDDAIAAIPAPMAKPQPAAKPSMPRGPHAERTATMRQKLIDAAIHCLYTQGYGATTTQLVLDTAQVSRGAILHHFPTKLDLMLAVADYAAGKQNRYIARRLGDFEPGMDRFLALTQCTWEVMQRPPAQALLEIMMAARSDTALAERLRPVVAAFEDAQRADVWRMARAQGIRDRAKVEAMTRLHVAAMRGLAIDLMWSGDQASAEESMTLLRRYKREITGELMTEPYAGQDEAPAGPA